MNTERNYRRDSFASFEQVTVRDLVRLPSSRSGNPRYVIVCEDHRQLTTAPNSGFAYELPNHIGEALILWLNSRGHVVSGTVNHLDGCRDDFVTRGEACDWGRG